MLTFQQTSRLLGNKWRLEAVRCVKTWGTEGRGDSHAALYIDACKADFVLRCVNSELAVHPGNELARDLKRHLEAALQ